jgi:hypothetical protein
VDKCKPLHLGLPSLDPLEVIALDGAFLRGEIAAGVEPEPARYRSSFPKMSFITLANQYIIAWLCPCPPS